MKPYRIMFISTGLAYGGAETQLLRLALWLRQRDWNVSVVSLMPPRAYVEELEQAGIPVFSLGIRNKLPNPRPLLHLATLIRRWKPAVVHSKMVHANLLARVTRTVAPVPVLISNASSTHEGSRLRELLYRLTDPLCDLTVQVSRAGLERYVRVGAVPPHKIRHVPNGVDTERFQPNTQMRERLRTDLGLQQRFVWLAVGRLETPKDYPNMLRALALVKEVISDVILLIAGDGPQRAELQSRVASLGLDDNLRFLGIRQDIPELMNAADAFVLSSSREGLPNVLLEAHATGLPAVATDVGGNREVVLDGETGLISPPHNPEALAQAMLRMMALPDEQRRSMAQAARQHIFANYSLDSVVERWETLYFELLSKKGVAIEPMQP